MSATDLNDVILGGVAQGMKAAADRFADRMAEIREQNVEQKLSQFWQDYAFGLAKQVDDLTVVLNTQNALLAEKDVLLRQAKERVESFRQLSTDHSNYLDLVVKRLTKVEDILQRQSAKSYALDEFRKVALKELENIQDPTKSALIDPQKRTDFLEGAWADFMQTTNVKRGTPRLGLDTP